MTKQAEKKIKDVKPEKAASVAETKAEVELEKGQKRIKLLKAYGTCEKGRVIIRAESVAKILIEDEIAEEV